MTTREQQVSYQTTNTYSCLNEHETTTKNVWFCCHGIGFLSRYFIRYFNTLNKADNFIIAPQAPSKYYQKSDFKYVGASWLTRENTTDDTKNVLSYFDAIAKKEAVFSAKHMVLFGFSQGVSVSLRWMASRKIDCDLLVIYAGGIPKELKPEDFDFITKTKVKIVYGREDEYFTASRMKEEVKRAEDLFGAERVEVLPFDGSHQVKSTVVKRLIAEEE